MTVFILAGKYYILLDEIQEVDGWEKVVNSLLVDLDTDIYVTGSNSRMLSSELATYLTGRYVAFHVMTLSFREYLTFHDLQANDPTLNRKEEFQKYLRMGGFPAIHTADYGYEAIYKIVYDIYSSVILRDTVQRHNIRNVELLERVVKFVFDNIGNKLNAKNIADYFKSQQRKVDMNTIYNYLNALESAFIIQRIPRYDINGKEILQTNEKYFVSDLSLIYSVMGYRDRLIAGMLENLVCLELKRRGYEVYVGKQDDKEVDFVAIRREEKIYVQVTYQLASQATVEREFAPLLAINDHYPKYVVSMDSLWQDNVDVSSSRYPSTCRNFLSYTRQFTFLKWDTPLFVCCPSIPVSISPFLTHPFCMDIFISCTNRCSFSMEAKRRSVMWKHIPDSIS